MREVPLRVVVVDASPIVGLGIRLLLERVHWITASSARADASALIATLRRHRPQVIVIGLERPAAESVDLIQRVRTLHPELPILVLAAEAVTDASSRVLRLGVRGYLPKTASIEALLRAIRDLAEGRAAIDPRAMGMAARSWRVGLTDRERQVLLGIVGGLRNGEIAEALVLSTKTIEYHMTRLLLKLRARSRSEAIVAAQRLGLLADQNCETWFSNAAARHVR